MQTQIVIIEQNQPIVQTSKVYSVKEAAHLVGCSEKTILRSIHSGSLKALCPGGKRYRITGADLASYLCAGSRHMGSANSTTEANGNAEAEEVR